MMHLQYFLDAANDQGLNAIYGPWIGRQVRAITDNAQQSSGDVGSIWPPNGKEQFGPQILGMAIHAGNAASKVSFSFKEPTSVAWLIDGFRWLSTVRHFQYQL